MNLSLEQSDIFNEFHKTSNNILVGATAGSGKTTTLVGLSNEIRNRRESVFLSFSKAIVNELKERLPLGFKAVTLHSLGYSIIASTLGQLTLDEKKYFKIAYNLLKESMSIDQTGDNKIDNKQIVVDSFKIQSLCNLMRLTLCDLEEQEVLYLIDRYALDANLFHASIAIEILDSLKLTTTIDFTDMLYYPHRFGFETPTFQNVLYDEVQDANKAQISLLEKILSSSSKLISVGDTHQTIYGFSGSDVNSFYYLRDRPKTALLPLQTCYRCGIDIVVEAQKEFRGRVINNEIKYYDKNHKGIVKTIQKLDNSVTDNDLVLCRNTAPLVSVFYELVQKGKKAKIVGKEIENGLLVIAELLSMFQHKADCINYFRRKEIELIEELLGLKISKPREHIRFITLREKHDILTIILNKVSSPTALIAQIKAIFDESKKGITLMTIHRSKGLENDRVFLVMRYKGEPLIPNKHAKMDWQIEQEYNLLFVAITRAKKELIYVQNVDEISI